MIDEELNLTGSATQLGVGKGNSVANTRVRLGYLVLERRVVVRREIFPDNVIVGGAGRVHRIPRSVSIDNDARGMIREALGELLARLERAGMPENDLAEHVDGSL